MASNTINLTAGQKADRKLEMHFVNVGTGEAPAWEIMGRGVEEASMEFNHDADQKTDILGITDVDVSAAKPMLALDPNQIRGGQKLSEKLLDIERRNAISELSMFEVLNVHAYMGETNVVDVYVRYLRGKIDDGFEKKLLHTVRGVGYVLREEP